MDQNFNWIKSPNQPTTTTAALPIHSMMDLHHLPPLPPIPAAVWALTTALQGPSPSSALPSCLRQRRPSSGGRRFDPCWARRGWEAVRPWILWPGCRHRRCRYRFDSTAVHALLSRALSPYAMRRHQHPPPADTFELHSPLKTMPPPAAVAPQAVPQRKPHGHTSAGEPEVPWRSSSGAEGWHYEDSSSPEHTGPSHRCSPTTWSSTMNIFLAWAALQPPVISTPSCHATPWVGIIWGDSSLTHVPEVPSHHSIPENSSSLPLCLLSKTIPRTFFLKPWPQNDFAKLGVTGMLCQGAGYWAGASGWGSGVFTLLPRGLSVLSCKPPASSYQSRVQVSTGPVSHLPAHVLAAETASWRHGGIPTATWNGLKYQHLGNSNPAMPLPKQAQRRIQKRKRGTKLKGRECDKALAALRDCKISTLGDTKNSAGWGHEWPPLSWPCYE